MKLESTNIEGIQIIHQFRVDDQRGSFVKTFHQNDFQKLGIDFQMRESFYSISHKNAIRGMHFHHPPHAHSKIVFCTDGAILDVVLDLRKSSKTYGKFFAQELSHENNCALFIPVGFAHGFVTLSESATTFYFVSGEYEQASDAGILFSSFGFDWNTPNPIMSTRDLNFVSLENFNSPF
jgi:dTDP-4-dehydrorhamnose 3,5-epimerase